MQRSKLTLIIALSIAYNGFAQFIKTQKHRLKIVWTIY
jgi:hypothetical protein